MTTTERRDRDRLDPQDANLLHEVVEPITDVLELRRVPPVLLGWEVQDETRGHQPANDVDLARHDLAGLARAQIGLEGVGKRLLELQGQPLAHHALRIHRVDERVDVGLQQVSPSRFDRHGHASNNIPARRSQAADGPPPASPGIAVLTRLTR